MPLHPDARAFLDKMADSPQPNEVSIEEFRRAASALVPGAPPLRVGPVLDVTIAGGDSQGMNVRVYTPEGTGPFPVVVWLHGGSFVRGTLDMFDAGRRAFTKASDCIVVSVDQRLSPEAQFPGPLLDGYAAFTWAVSNSVALGGDPALVGVAGESSGGNLAAALALMARDKDGPKAAFQLLIEPLLDAHCGSPSMDEFAESYILTKSQLVWAYKQYAPNVSRDNPLISPLRATNMLGLPPTAIVTVEYDPVRDDGEQYAVKLAEAGVPVLNACMAGMVHHFPGPDLIPTSARLLRQLIRGK
jgi:acetyl esterase